MLDPYPRLILVKGIGIFSTGPTFKDAKIAMDVGLNSLSVILQAAKFGNFKSIPEKEIFRMEYWPLELAKIKNSSQKLKGQVAVVTGGLGGIGYVTAQKFKAEGADVIIIDMPPGTGDVSISLSQFLNFYETIIVTTPQSNATVVAERAGIMSKKVNSSIIGVIENMSHIELKDSKLFLTFIYSFKTVPIWIISFLY